MFPGTRDLSNTEIPAACLMPIDPISNAPRRPRSDLTGRPRCATPRPVPTVVLRPVLWEVDDVVEQVFRTARTENLHPRPEEYGAATCDYATAHGLPVTSMRLAMRQYGTGSEVHERAQVIALMRSTGSAGVRGIQRVGC